MEANDTDDIKKRTEALNEVAMKLATKVYEEAAKNKQTEQTTESTEETKKDKDSKDDVEEANYEEK